MDLFTSWMDLAKARLEWVQKGVEGGRRQMVTVILSLSVKDRRARIPLEKGF